MTKQTTDTSTRVLVPQDHYEFVCVERVEKKEIKQFIIYEWCFSTEVDGQPFNFKIGLFSSQMADLLRALGATELSPNKFEWDDEEVIGKYLSFNVVHIADKKGIIRENLSDIMSVNAPQKEVAWDSDK